MSESESTSTAFDPSPYKPGDVVYLVSGGLPMTVDNVQVYANLGARIYTKFFDSAGAYHAGFFPPEMLTAVNPVEADRTLAAESLLRRLVKAEAGEDDIYDVAEAARRYFEDKS